MAQHEDDLNRDALSAPFPTRDQARALDIRRLELLDVMEACEDQSWRNNPRDELRAALRVVNSEANKVDKRLQAASAVMRRDFDLSHD